MYIIVVKRKAGKWQNHPFHISSGHSAANPDSERSFHGCKEVTTWNSYFYIFLRKYRGELQSTRNNIPKKQKHLNFKDFEKNRTILPGTKSFKNQMEKFTWDKCYCPTHTKLDKSSSICFHWSGIPVGRETKKILI